jgi:hypothetical protein
MRIVALSSLVVACLLASIGAVSASSAASARAARIASPSDGGSPVSQVDWSISCGSPTTCLAVGFSEDNAVGSAVALKGTKWKPIPVPLQSGSVLDSVSCKAATYCLVTGHNEYAGGPYLLTWNGTSLAQVPMPPVPRGDTLSSFDAVSCVAVKSCVVFGQTVNAADDRVERAWTWNGSKWAGKGAAYPRWRYISVSFAHCFSLTSCEVIGQYATEQMADGMLFAAWNGKKFTLQRSAAPTGILDQGLFTGFSCVSPRSCAAVGTIPKCCSGYDMSFLANWKGKTWTVSQWTGTENIDAELNGVSCVTAANCVAVGRATNEIERTERAASFIWNGTKWLKAGVPGAGPGISTSFNSVSCLKADRCVAIGNYYGPSSSGAPTMAGYWNGRGWKLTGV